jgi:hypothetical protein
MDFLLGILTWIVAGACIWLGVRAFAVCLGVRSVIPREKWPGDIDLFIAAVFLLVALFCLGLPKIRT